MRKRSRTDLMRRLARSGAVAGYLFLAPALLLVLVFRVWPGLQAFPYAFTDWTGAGAAAPVGWGNFAEMLRDGVFWAALRNNVFLSLAVPFWVLASLALALLIHDRTPGWRFFRGAFFLPSVLSPVIVGTLFGAILRADGPLNEGLRSIGLGALARDWLGDPAAALPVMTLVILWGIFGLGVIFFLAGLAAVPPEIFESARLDGARGWSMLAGVVAPSLRHVLEFWTVNLVVWSFTSLFAFVYVMTRGGPGYATMLVEFQLFQQAFEFNRMGYACALGSALFLLVFGVVLLQLRLMTAEDA